MREGMKIIIPSVAQGHRCQWRQEGRKDRKERVEFVICKFHPLPALHAQAQAPVTLAPSSTQPRVVREDYSRKVPGIGRDHVEIRVLCDATVSLRLRGFSPAR